MPDLMHKIETHLEELDYEIRDKGEGVREAAHDARWNFVFVEELDGVLVRSYIETSPGAERSELLEFIDDVHREAVVARMFVDDSGDLALEAWWPSLYDPEEFHTFVRAWNHDISLMAGHPDVQNLVM